LARAETRSRLWAIAPLAVLVFAAWQVAATLSRTPAFNRSLQVEAATGSTLPALLQANYNRADYYYWISLGWQTRTGQEKIHVEAPTPVLVETIQRRNRLIRDMATESLRHNPASAHTWMLLARVKAELGDAEGALEAWQASFDWAPHNSSLSFERLVFLIRFMIDPAGWDLALSRIDPDMVRVGLETIMADRVFRGTVKSYSDSPAIVAFVG